MELGLGSAETVDLERARDIARQYNVWLASGKDPEQERAKEAGKAVTVNQVADEYYKSKIEGESESYRKLVAQQYLGNYIRPAIGNMPIAEVTRPIVRATKWGPRALTLEELWSAKHTTAAQLRMHLTRIWYYAEEEGYIDSNPITSRWFTHFLPRRKSVHRPIPHDSVPYKEVYDFIQAVRASREPRPTTLKYWGGRAQRHLWLTPIKALIIEFQIFTGVRHNEIRQAQWKEINWDELTWTAPLAHTKTREYERAIPITRPMQDILEEVRHRTTDHSPNALIFPGTHGRVIGASAMATFLRRQVKWKIKVDPHGARSTLRDWMRAETDFDDVAWKIQVGHLLGDMTSRAYGHDKLLELRRQMMTAYAKHCTTPPPTEVINLADKRKRA
jgi:integrase